MEQPNSLGALETVLLLRSFDGGVPMVEEAGRTLSEISREFTDIRQRECILSEIYVHTSGDLKCGRLEFMV